MRRRLLRRPAARVGLAPAALLGVIAVTGPLWVADPDRPDYADQLPAPSAAHPLGTDRSGRDLLARAVTGAGTSLGEALLVTAINVTVGLLVGTAVGSAGGLVDIAVTRLTDIVLGLPSPVLTLAVVTLLGPGFGNLVLAMAATAWALPHGRCRRGSPAPWHAAAQAAGRDRRTHGRCRSAPDRRRARAAGGSRAGAGVGRPRPG